MTSVPSQDLVISPDDLQCVEIIGRDSYGEVWRGLWNGKGGGITVAIKKIPVIGITPTIQKEVYNEVEILSKFSHPNILTIFGACFVQKELWMVMEFMDGGSLYEFLHSEHDIDWNMRLSWAQQTTRGLNILHSSVPAVLHRDVKSLNLMVSKDGLTLKLIDFGTSKVSQVASAVLSSVPREAIGTSRWKAPETLWYPPQWSTKADIYSLGITFYEIAARKIPFEEVEDNETVIHIVQVKKQRPELPHDCPQEFSQLIEECWQHDPQKRPTCLNLLAKLDTIIASSSNLIQSHGEVVDSRRFSQPVVDSRRFSQPDNVSTFAGSTPGNVDGRGINAKFNSPGGICFHLQDECFYLCDYANNSIKKVTLQGDATTFAVGNHLSQPVGIVSSNKENIFFVTNYTGHTISKITSSGTISCFAGSGQTGSADGIGTNASFNNPCGIAIDQQSGNLFVSDYNHKIRKITSTGIVSTLAGSDSGFADGNGNSAKFNAPCGICFAAYSGSLIVCDCANNKLRRVQLNGDVSTICDISYPRFVAITANNTILVSSLHCLYKVTYQGSQKYKTEVIAGGKYKEGKQDGKLSESLFNDPTGIIVHEPSHSLFVCEHSNHDIRQVSFVNI